MYKNFKDVKIVDGTLQISFDTDSVSTSQSQSIEPSTILDGASEQNQLRTTEETTKAIAMGRKRKQDDQQTDAEEAATQISSTRTKRQGTDLPAGIDNSPQTRAMRTRAAVKNHTDDTPIAQLNQGAEQDAEEEPKDAAEAEQTGEDAAEEAQQDDAEAEQTGEDGKEEALDD